MSLKEVLSTKEFDDLKPGDRIDFLYTTSNGRLISSTIEVVSEHLLGSYETYVEVEVKKGRYCNYENAYVRYRGERTRLTKERLREICGEIISAPYNGD